MASVTDEHPRVDLIARMMEGPPANDEDYDTDLEEDFPPGEWTFFCCYDNFAICIIHSSFQATVMDHSPGFSQTFVGGGGLVQKGAP